TTPTTSPSISSVAKPVVRRSAPITRSTLPIVELFVDRKEAISSAELRRTCLLRCYPGPRRLCQVFLALGPCLFSHSVAADVVHRPGKDRTQVVQGFKKQVGCIGATLRRRSYGTSPSRNGRGDSGVPCQTLAIRASSSRTRSGGIAV